MRELKGLKEACDKVNYLNMGIRKSRLKLFCFFLGKYLH